MFSFLFLPEKNDSVWHVDEERKLHDKKTEEESKGHAVYQGGPNLKNNLVSDGKDDVKVNYSK